MKETEMINSWCMPLRRKGRWEPELKGNYYPLWEEVYAFFFFFSCRDCREVVRSRADADIFVGSMAGNCAHCFSLSFLGPSWLGIRIKTLSMGSCLRDGHNPFSFLGLPLGFLPPRLLLTHVLCCLFLTC